MHQDLPALFVIFDIVLVIFLFTIWQAKKDPKGKDDD